MELRCFLTSANVHLASGARRVTKKVGLHSVSSCVYLNGTITQYVAVEGYMISQCLVRVQTLIFSLYATNNILARIPQ